MKKGVFYGLVASVSMFSLSAYATDASESALTTKGYVDAGLKHVYKVANGTSNGAVKNLQNALSDGNGGLINVGDLQTAIGSESVGQTPGSGLLGDVETLQDKIGNTAMGTQAGTVTGAIKELKDAVDSVETNNYTDGTGIKITPGANGDPASIGLDISDPAAGSYTYQVDDQGNGTWAPIEVEDSWDPGFLTNP